MWSPSSAARRDPDRVVIITGHIDSRVTDPMNATADAPGANDDGSGTAAVIEAARVLSRHRFPATIVYAALSGEEQGLVGGRSSPTMPGRRAGRSRPISTTTSSATAAARTGSATTPMSGSSPKGCAGRAATRSGRWCAARAARTIRPRATCRASSTTLADELSLGLDVRQIWRNDRFGRGGDHTEFLNAGFPAVRFSVAVENYNWQHQDLRTENGVEYGDTIERMDFPYLRRVTQLNVAALAALARAPMPPAPTVEGAVSTDTTLHWDAVPGAAALCRSLAAHRREPMGT